MNAAADGCKSHFNEENLLDFIEISLQEFQLKWIRVTWRYVHALHCQ
jgi:hypothetical protein